ncbi:MAG TPA: hypothetical protein VF556_16710 [Pyrinomonadaceae bacterium]|jgi:hypothetical protein
MKTPILSSIFYVLFCVSVFSQGAQKLDEFENIPCDEYLARMDYAMNEAEKNSSSTVYIFIYEGKEMKYNDRKKKSELVFPGYGSAKEKIRSIKKYMWLRNFSVKKIKFVEAGFRDNSTVEIWLVPVDASQPKPNPTLKKMRYRKGKPTGFCWWCCG